MTTTRPFDRVLIVMFENQYRQYVQENPYMGKLSQAGASMNNYFGCFHPSQTNYVASLTGEVCGVTDDTPPANPLPQSTIVDLLVSKNVTWKAYMEDYPGQSWNAAWANPPYDPSLQPITKASVNGNQYPSYFRKHNAFASSKSIQSSKELWAGIVDENQFWNDVNTDNLPEYSWFTPNIWHDGHYVTGEDKDAQPRTLLVPQIADWLENTFFGSSTGGQSGNASVGLNLDIDLLISNPEQAWQNSNVPPGTLIVLTFDEADFDAAGQYEHCYDGPNQIYTVLLGDMITPGTQIDTPFNHYSLIKTIERNYNLGSLGKNDEGANHFHFLWNESFAWEGLEDTGLQPGAQLAVANLNSQNYVLFSDADNSGTIHLARQNHKDWTVIETLSEKTTGAIAMAAGSNELVIALAGVNNGVFAIPYSLDGGLGTGQGVVDGTASSIALAAYSSEGGSTEGIMLCYNDHEGNISSQLYQGQVWQNVQSVNDNTDGAMQLAQMGPSLYLVFKETGTNNMKMTSFNLASFNAFPAHDSTTSQMEWSPVSYYVRHFAFNTGPDQTDYQLGGNMAMATLTGEMHLIYNSAAGTGTVDSQFGLTGIFTAQATGGNEYGTLDQAGWTAEEPLNDVELTATSPLAMASNGDGLFFYWVPEGGKNLKVQSGSYSSNS